MIRLCRHIGGVEGKRSAIVDVRDPGHDSNLDVQKLSQNPRGNVSDGRRLLEPPEAHVEPVAEMKRAWQSSYVSSKVTPMW
jgi:hypothetical protein